MTTIDWTAPPPMGEIYTCARPSDFLDESKGARLLRFRLMHVKNVRSFGKESNMGKSR